MNWRFGHIWSYEAKPWLGWKHAVKRDILKLTNEKLHTLKFACFYICFFSRICGLKLNPSACWKTPFLHISSFCKHASSFKFHFMDSLQIMWRHFAWFADSPFFCMYECKLLTCKFQCRNIYLARLVFLIECSFQLQLDIW